MILMLTTVTGTLADPKLLPRCVCKVEWSSYQHETFEYSRFRFS